MKDSEKRSKVMHCNYEYDEKNERYLSDCGTFGHECRDWGYCPYCSKPIRWSSVTLCVCLSCEAREAAEPNTECACGGMWFSVNLLDSIDRAFATVLEYACERIPEGWSVTMRAETGEATLTLESHRDRIDDGELFGGIEDIAAALVMRVEYAVLANREASRAIKIGRAAKHDH